MIHLHIKGLDKAQKDFARLGARFPKFTQDATLKAVLYVHQNMPDYPPKPPNSTYDRRFLLFKSVTHMKTKHPEALSRVEPRFGSVTGIVGTRLSYAPWVIDKSRQTRTHKAHGWWNLQDVVKGMRTGIYNVYRQAMKKFIMDNIR